VCIIILKFSKILAPALRRKKKGGGGGSLWMMQDNDRKCQKKEVEDSPKWEYEEVCS
jgi:hypothetical protein